ncbi:MAG: class II fumarate hydratase [Candidatus Obscuribacter sp.]|nr:class II fumarate hydratase [Candidatus Obscuribacter sp.]
MTKKATAGKQPLRIERDSMGEMSVPSHALWGASTERAALNFPIGNIKFSRPFILSLALIKMAAARANKSLKDLDAQTADAIIAACAGVAAGDYDEHFVVSIFQTGSGTSTNMNANEVIANLARQALGKDQSDRAGVHPNDHVNMGQSSNDVIPTAIHVALVLELSTRLLPSLKKLSRELSGKARSFKKTLKTGRTHLQDATPVTFGQEFSGYKAQVDASIARLEATVRQLSNVALGGTAVGTGINTREGFAALTLKHLSKDVSKAAGLPLTFKEAKNHFAAQGSIDALVDAAGALQTLATALNKIANDVRWMASGPRAGLNEVLLPAIQPGSSIMPGKVNPVICEAVMQVGYRVLGNCQTVVFAHQSSNFELNVALPIVAHSLLESVGLLADAASVFVDKCLAGMKTTNSGPQMVERGLALCTALAPVIGYDQAAQIAKEADKTGETILAVALRLTKLSEAELKRILDPEVMTRPGLSGAKMSG